MMSIYTTMMPSSSINSNSIIVTQQGLVWVMIDDGDDGGDFDGYDDDDDDDKRCRS